jgi:hypothetical protein
MGGFTCCEVSERLFISDLHSGKSAALTMTVCVPPSSRLRRAAARSAVGGTLHPVGAMDRTQGRPALGVVSHSSRLSEHGLLQTYLIGTGSDTLGLQGEKIKNGRNKLEWQLSARKWASGERATTPNISQCHSGPGVA